MTGNKKDSPGFTEVCSHAHMLHVIIALLFMVVEKLTLAVKIQLAGAIFDLPFVTEKKGTCTSKHDDLGLNSPPMYADDENIACLLGQSYFK